VFQDVIADALASGNRIRFRAAGTSMLPTIRDGDLITIAPVAPNEIVAGDVLLCRHGDRLFAHRLVAVTRQGPERMLELRGDCNTDADAIVSERAIVAKVIDVSRNGRVIPLAGWRARVRHRLRTASARVTHTMARVLPPSR
jgi:signal peptidase I